MSFISRIAGCALLMYPSVLAAQAFKEDVPFILDNYNKQEVYIRMRDGNKLFTAVYEPKEKGEKYPILIERTPYSCSPYGADKFPFRLGPNSRLMKEKYIIVYQDVR